MNELDIHIENCYGIKELKHKFNFENSKAHIVYAPNGVMKSSFALTLDDIAEGKTSKDRIFSDRINHRDVKIDNLPISPEQIFVIQRMKSVDFKEASTILANESLKKEYDLLNSNLNESKNSFLQLIQPLLGIKQNQIESELEVVFEKDLFDLFKTHASTIDSIVDPLYKEIDYGQIFNDKSLKALNSKGFKTKISEYIALYDTLINNSNKLFMKGTFNHYNAESITKSLKDNNFFSAKHSVKIKDKEINNAQELEELINEEKEKVLKNPELMSKFNEIDKALNSNNETRLFRKHIEENPEIIKEFGDLKNFRKKLIINKIAVIKSEFNVLLTLYRQTSDERVKITSKAKLEQDLWKKVIDIFKQRFTIPFEVLIENQEDVILNNKPASLIFKYTDGADTKLLGGPELQESLSTGEQRVFYLLNIIFQIETRKKLNTNQLVIVDDIADSFDYKNKYAIIEYLKDVLDDPHCFMIILTHNFDFYKTIKSRLGAKVNYQGNWTAIRRNGKIELVAGEKKDVFPLLRTTYDICDFAFIACIPFVRNLIEFSVGSDNNEYLLLTSLLHLKPVRVDESVPRTEDISVNEVLNIFNSIFKLDKSREDSASNVYTLIISKTEEIVSSNGRVLVDLKHKICISIAIRLLAEKFMIAKITDRNFHENIFKKQTGQIVGKYREEFPSEEQNISILDRVNLMTPENIHVNSFMYEPLMDLTDEHLRLLYNDVKTLA